MKLSPTQVFRFLVKRVGDSGTIKGGGRGSLTIVMIATRPCVEVVDRVREAGVRTPTHTPIHTHRHEDLHTDQDFIYNISVIRDRVLFRNCLNFKIDNDHLFGTALILCVPPN